MEVYRSDKNKWPEANGVAVLTALRWYAFGSVNEVITKHPGYTVITEPLVDYLAISTRTAKGSPIRDVAVSLLDTLAGVVAIRVAVTTVNGEGKSE